MVKRAQHGCVYSGIKCLQMIKKLLLILLICNIAMTAFSQSLIVGTFNLRYDNPRDTGNLWKDRAPVAAALIRFHQFDIVGTQEGLKNQLDDLQAALPAYTYYGRGRDDGQSKGEHSAIFYRKDKFSVLDSGDFWLSQTPEKPGPGWDARLNRICSWLKLRTVGDKKTFYVFNVHYDHEGIQARIESSKLILAKIKAIAGNAPVVFTGDFNGNHQSEWYNYLRESIVLKDALTLAADPYRNNGSFNSFRVNNASNDIIDHIFISDHFKVSRYGILTDTYHGRFPSDHYPVLVELSW
jgi:endonuclease/exonuclease/phosphatase family metal-dependent hydrolase